MPDQPGLERLIACRSLYPVLEETDDEESIAGGESIEEVVSAVEPVKAIEPQAGVGSIDEEGAERIDALPASRADETWSICVYFVGADLEDDTENDLSYVTTIMTRDAKQDAADEKRMAMMDRLNRYYTELADNGLELPKFFYYPDVPVASSTVVRNGEDGLSLRPGITYTGRTSSSVRGR